MFVCVYVGWEGYFGWEDCKRHHPRQRWSAHTHTHTPLHITGQKKVVLDTWGWRAIHTSLCTPQVTMRVVGSLGCGGVRHAQCKKHWGGFRSGAPYTHTLGRVADGMPMGGSGRHRDCGTSCHTVHRRGAVQVGPQNAPKNTGKELIGTCELRAVPPNHGGWGGQKRICPPPPPPPPPRPTPPA